MRPGPPPAQPPLSGPAPQPSSLTECRLTGLESGAPISPAAATNCSSRNALTPQARRGRHAVAALYRRRRSSARRSPQAPKGVRDDLSLALLAVVSAAAVLGNGAAVGVEDGDDHADVEPV